MKYKLPGALLFGLLVILLWRVTSHTPKSDVESVRAKVSSRAETTGASTTPSEPVTAEETPGVVQDSTASDPVSNIQGRITRAEAIPDRAQHIARTPSLENSIEPETPSSLPIGIVLENVRNVFRQYCLRFGGNPVGNNSEITAALNGKNLRQVVFLKSEDGTCINEHGELVDNWGTPYFFHQLSGTEMEIHSAGPDRKMWTRDDLVIK